MFFLLNTVLYYIGWLALKAIIRVRLQKDIAWYAPMPRGPKILVANHPSVSDPFILPTTVRDQTSILIFGPVFGIPLFGRYLKMSGHVPVYADNHRKAFDAALKHLKEGISVLIFIEGKVSPNPSEYARPHTGPVRLAYESGAPIVPIGIGVQPQNLRNIPHIIGRKRSLGRWYIRGRYGVTIGKSLHLTGDTKDKAGVKTVSNSLMGKIVRLAQESAARINKKA